MFHSKELLYDVYQYNSIINNYNYVSYALLQCCILITIYSLLHLRRTLYILFEDKKDFMTGCYCST